MGPKTPAMSLISELKRRNVFRVALLYLVAGWVILQVAELLFDVLKLPDWTSRLVLGLLMLGFPLALIFSWVYELTPEGLKREHEIDRNQSVTHATARKLDMVVGALLVVAIGMLAFDRYADRERTAGGTVESRTATPHRGGRAAAGAHRTRVDRRAALRQHERRRGERLLLRRAQRGAAQRAREGAGAARHRAHLVVRVQGQGRDDRGRSRRRSVSITCSRAASASRATASASPRS